MSQSKELFMQVRSEQMAANQGISFEHLIDAKKENLQTAVNTIIAAVKNGEVDELKTLILAKKGTELFSLLEKQVRPLAEDAKLFKIGKDYVIHDVKVEQAETGVKYDYTACGDPEWNKVSSEVSEATERQKERETFLKSVTKPMTIVDEDTGDIITINPPVRSGKIGLKLTIK